MTTTSERALEGKRARVTVPLEDQARVEVPTSRLDPVALLERQGESRVPDLLPIRYGRMAASPFAFFRGAALIMAADLAATPHSGLTVQLCGDAHMSNFGVFASPERRLVFDLNDFDETLPGPFEWDVKRLAASFAVACRDESMSRKQTMAIARAVGTSYRLSMREFAAMGNQAVWYARLDVEEFIADLEGVASPARVRRLQRLVTQAKSKDNLQAFDKLTQDVDGEPRFVSEPPLIVPTRELLPDELAHRLMARMTELLHAYRESLVSDRRHLFDQYRFVDMARKVVGVGSVGTRAWVLLFEGLDSGDPLILQAKEAQASVLEAFVGASEYDNHGQRVVAGQRLMQAASDIFLGWQRTAGIDDVDRDYYVRQLRDWKGSLDFQGASAGSLERYARICGWTLARAHARSGDRVAISAYLGKSTRFEDAIASFSQAYAEQNERDHRALLDAIDAGRITATQGI